MNKPQLTAEMNETMSAYMMKCPHCQTIIDLPQEKETPMQNKPQLTAEMEKRFNEAFPNEESGYLNKQGKYVHLFNPAVDTREIKTFLATALEEQRKQVLDEVEKLVGDIYDGSDWHTGRHALVDELRTKLNQLKRGK